jgi:hypothetical protein
MLVGFPVVVKSKITLSLPFRANRGVEDAWIRSYPCISARVRSLRVDEPAGLEVRAMRRGLLDLSMVERPTRWPAPTQLRGALDPSQHPPGALGLLVGLVSQGNP